MTLTTGSDHHTVGLNLFLFVVYQRIPALYKWRFIAWKIIYKYKQRISQLAMFDYQRVLDRSIYINRLIKFELVTCIGQHGKHCAPQQHFHFEAHIVEPFSKRIRFKFSNSAHNDSRPNLVIMFQDGSFVHLAVAFLVTSCYISTYPWAIRPSAVLSGFPRFPGEMSTMPLVFLSLSPSKSAGFSLIL